MNLDDISTAFRLASNDPVVSKLSDLLSAWKDDSSNVNDLEDYVERYIGNTWIANSAEHVRIYNLWFQFRDDAIHKIGDKTMNERLYSFSLLPRWDGYKTDEDRMAIYAKLLANPYDCHETSASDGK